MLYRQMISTESWAEVFKEVVGKCKALLQRYHAGFPMARVHRDILGLFKPSEHGNVYVLVINCRLIHKVDRIECAAFPN